MAELYAGETFEDRSQLLGRFRQDYTQYNDWGDKSLYSVMALTDPTLETRVKKDAKPEFRTGSQYLKAYRESNPAVANLDDSALGEALVSSMPELSVFGFKGTKAAAPAKVEEPVVSQFKLDHPQWIGPEAKGDITQLRGFNEYQEVLNANAQGRAGFWDEFGENAASTVPFYGSIKAAVDVGKLAITATRMQSGEAVDDQDLLDLNIFLADQDRASNAGWLGKAGAAVANSIGFAGEFAISALLLPAFGAGVETEAAAIAARSAGKLSQTALQKMVAGFAKKRVWDAVGEAAEKGAQKILLKNVKAEAAEAYMKSRTFRAVTGAAGAVAKAATGGAIQTGIVTGAQLITTAGTEGGPTTASAAQNQLYAALGNDPMSRGKAFALGLTQDFIERSTEFTGDAVLKGLWLGAPAKWAAKFAQFESAEALKVGADVARKTVDATKKKFALSLILETAAKKYNIDHLAAAKWLKKVGYDGIVQEMAEERLGGFLHGLLGTDGSEGGLRSAINGAIPDTEQAMSELLSFSLPIGTLVAADKVQKHLAGVFGNDIVGAVGRLDATINPKPELRKNADGSQEYVDKATWTPEESEQKSKLVADLAQKGQEAGPPAARIVDFAMSLLTFPLHYDPTRLMHGTLERALQSEELPNIIGAYRSIYEARVQGGLSAEEANKLAYQKIKDATPAAYAKKVVVQGGPEVEAEIREKIKDGSIRKFHYAGQAVMEPKDDSFSGALRKELARQGWMTARPLRDDGKISVDHPEIETIEEALGPIEASTPEGRANLQRLAVLSGIGDANSVVNLASPKFFEAVEKYFSIHKRAVEDAKGTVFKPGMKVRQTTDKGPVYHTILHRLNDHVVLKDVSGLTFEVPVSSFGTAPGQDFQRLAPMVHQDRTTYYGTRAQIEKVEGLLGKYRFEDVAQRLYDQETDGKTETIYGFSLGMTNRETDDGRTVLRWRAEASPYHIFEDMVWEARARALWGYDLSGQPRIAAAMTGLAGELRAMLKETKIKVAVESGKTKSAKEVADDVIEASRDLQDLIEVVENKDGWSETFFKLVAQMEAGYDQANYSHVDPLPYHQLFAQFKAEASGAWDLVRDEFIGIVDEILEPGWQGRYANPYMGTAAVKLAAVKPLASEAGGSEKRTQDKKNLKKVQADKANKQREAKAQKDAENTPEAKPPVDEGETPEAKPGNDFNAMEDEAVKRAAKQQPVKESEYRKGNFHIVGSVTKANVAQLTSATLQEVLKERTRALEWEDRESEYPSHRFIQLLRSEIQVVEKELAKRAKFEFQPEAPETGPAKWAAEAAKIAHPHNAKVAITPEAMVTLYRGEGGARQQSAANGEWWTVVKGKAEGYGTVRSIQVPALELAKGSAQGHGGEDEYIIPAGGELHSKYVLGQKPETESETPEQREARKKKEADDLMGEAPVSSDDLAGKSEDELEEMLGKLLAANPALAAMDARETELIAAYDKALAGQVDPATLTRMDKELEAYKDLFEKAMLADPIVGPVFAAYDRFFNSNETPSALSANVKRNTINRLGDYLDYLEQGGDERLHDWGRLVTELKAASPEEMDSVLKEMTELEATIKIHKMPRALLAAAIQYKYLGSRDARLAKAYREELDKGSPDGSFAGKAFDRMFGTEEEAPAEPSLPDEEETDKESYESEQKLRDSLNSRALKLPTQLARRYFGATQVHVSVANAYREHKGVVDAALRNPEAYSKFRATEPQEGASPNLKALWNIMRFTPYRDAVQTASKWWIPVMQRPLITFIMSSDGARVEKVYFPTNQSSSRLIDTVENTLSEVFTKPERMETLRPLTKALQDALAGSDKKALAKSAVALLQAISDERGDGSSAAAVWVKVGEMLVSDSKDHAKLVQNLDGLNLALGQALRKSEETDWKKKWSASVTKILFGGAQQLKNNSNFTEFGMPKTNPGRSALSSIIAVTSRSDYAESASAPDSGSRQMGYAGQSAIMQPGFLALFKGLGLEYGSPSQGSDEPQLPPRDISDLTTDELSILQRALYDKAADDDAVALYYIPFNGIKAEDSFIEIPKGEIFGGKEPLSYEEAYRKMGEIHMARLSMPRTYSEVKSFLTKRLDKANSSGWSFVDVDDGVKQEKMFIRDVDTDLGEGADWINGLKIVTRKHAEKQSNSLGLPGFSVLKVTTVSNGATPVYDKTITADGVSEELQPAMDALEASEWDTLTDTGGVKVFPKDKPATLTLASGEVYTGWIVDTPVDQQRVVGILDKAPVQKEHVLPLPPASYGVNTLGGRGAETSKIMADAVLTEQAIRDSEKLVLADEVRETRQFDKATLAAMSSDQALAYLPTRELALELLTSSLSSAAPKVMAHQSVVMPSGGYYNKNTKAFFRSSYYSPATRVNGKLRLPTGKANVKLPGFRIGAVLVPGASYENLVAELAKLSPRNTDMASRIETRKRLAGLLGHFRNGKLEPISSDVSFDDLFDVNGELHEHELRTGADIPDHLKPSGTSVAVPGGVLIEDRTPTGPNAHRAIRIWDWYTTQVDASGRTIPGPQNWHAMHPKTQFLGGLDHDADKDLARAPALVRNEDGYGAAKAIPVPTADELSTMEPLARKNRIRELRRGISTAINDNFIQSIYQADDFDIESAIDTGFLENLRVPNEAAPGSYELVKKLTESGALPAPPAGLSEDERVKWTWKEFNKLPVQQRLRRVAQNSVELRGVIVAEYAISQMLLRHLGVSFPDRLELEFFNNIAKKQDRIVVSRPLADPANDRVVALALSNFVSFAIDDPSKPQTHYLMMTPDTLGLFVVMAAGQHFTATTEAEAKKQIEAFYQTFVGFLDSKDMRDFEAAKDKYVGIGKPTLSRTLPDGKTKTFKGMAAVMMSLTDADWEIPATIQTVETMSIWARQLMNLRSALLSFKQRPGDLRRYETIHDALITRGGFALRPGAENDPMLLASEKVLDQYRKLYLSSGSVYANEFIRKLAIGYAGGTATAEAKPYGSMSAARFATFQKGIEQALMMEAVAELLPPAVATAVKQIGHATSLLKAMDPNGNKTGISEAALRIAEAAQRESYDNGWLTKTSVAQSGKLGAAQRLEFLVRQNDDLTAERVAFLNKEFDRIGDSWAEGKLAVTFKTTRLGATTPEDVTYKFTADQVKLVFAWYALQNSDKQLLGAMSPAFHQKLAESLDIVLGRLGVEGSQVQAKHLMAHVRNQKYADYKPMAYSQAVAPKVQAWRPKAAVVAPKANPAEAAAIARLEAATPVVLQSDASILSPGEQALIERGAARIRDGKKPRIAVASEHSDPAFHAEEVKRKLAEGKDSFDLLYLITKHDGLPMRELLALSIPKYIHFSVTTLGGTAYEPGVMKWRDLIKKVGEYIAQGLKPEMVTIRVDPVVPGVTKESEVRELIQAAKALGIRRFKMSVLDAYGPDAGTRRDVVTPLKALGYDFAAYKKADGTVGFTASDAEIKRWETLIADEAGPDSEVLTCAEKVLDPRVKQIGCVSIDVVNQIFGTEATQNERSRRIGCGCFGSAKNDLLAYSSACASACAYCYAGHGTRKHLEYYNSDGTLKANAFTRASLAQGPEAAPGARDVDAPQSDRQMSFPMPATENITGKNTTTAQLIRDGLRTGSTRHWQLEYQAGNRFSFTPYDADIPIEVTEMTPKIGVMIKALVKGGATQEAATESVLRDLAKYEGWTYERFRRFYDAKTTVSDNSRQLRFKYLGAPKTAIPAKATASEFEALPAYRPGQKTLTYAGVGSRRTPADMQKRMTALASELATKGYTLRSGGAEGADRAFEAGAGTKKEIYYAKDATARTRAIAREVHPAPSALDQSANAEFVWGLMARNTNQVFGRQLDTPVDFVLTWTPDGIESGSERTRESGGTGQAIDMASRKGIPVINMQRADWRERLDALLAPVAAPIAEPVKQVAGSRDGAELFAELDADKAALKPIMDAIVGSAGFQKTVASNNRPTPMFKSVEEARALGTSGLLKWLALELQDPQTINLRPLEETRATSLARHIVTGASKTLLSQAMRELLPATPAWPILQRLAAHDPREGGTGGVIGIARPEDLRKTIDDYKDIRRSAYELMRLGFTQTSATPAEPEVLPVPVRDLFDRLTLKTEAAQDWVVAVPAELPSDVLRDSKTGSPIVVYRGYATNSPTPNATVAGTFREGKGRATAYSYEGLYFASTEKIARQYAELKADPTFARSTGKHPHVSAYYLRMSNPHWLKNEHEMLVTSGKTLTQYDGAIIPFDTAGAVGNTDREYIVRSADQVIPINEAVGEIKVSSSNAGTPIPAAPATPAAPVTPEALPLLISDIVSEIDGAEELLLDYGQPFTGSELAADKEEALLKIRDRIQSLEVGSEDVEAKQEILKQLPESAEKEFTFDEFNAILDKEDGNVPAQKPVVEPVKPAPAPAPQKSTGYLPSSVVEGQLLLGDGRMAPASKGQTDGFELLQELAEDSRKRPSKLTYRIIGQPGVGKTSMLNEFLRRIRLRFGYSGRGIPEWVVMAAPMHTAAGVVAFLTSYWSKSSRSSAATRTRPDVHTVASALGGQFEEPIGKKYKPGDYVQKGQMWYPTPEFIIRTNNPYLPPIATAKMFIVDESSMVSKGDIEMLKEWQAATGVNLVVIGDSAQLPPVARDRPAGEGTERPSIGSAFAKEFALKTVELTEVMRQAKGNPLLDILQGLRKAIFSDAKTAAQSLKLPDAEMLSGKGEGYLSVGSMTQVYEALGVGPGSQVAESARFASGTNDGVGRGNQDIYKRLYPTSERQVEPGTLLMAYANAALNGELKGKANELSEYLGVATYYNADDFIVTAVGEFGTLGGPVPELSKLKGRFVNLEALRPGEARLGKKTHRVFLTEASEGRALLNAINALNIRKRTAFTARDWGEGFALRDLVRVAEAGIVSFKSQTPVGATDAESADRGGLNKAMDLGYWRTVYKLQGSQSPIIVVDSASIDLAKFPLFDKLQLKYVGLSRATKVAVAVQRSTASPLTEKAVAALKAAAVPVPLQGVPDLVENADAYGTLEAFSMESVDSKYESPDQRSERSYELPQGTTPEDRALVKAMGAESASALSAIYNMRYGMNRHRHLGLKEGAAAMHRMLIEEMQQAESSLKRGIADINRRERIFGIDGVLYEMPNLEDIKSGKRGIFERGALKEVGRLTTEQREQSERFRWVPGAILEYREKDEATGIYVPVVGNLMRNPNLSIEQKRAEIEKLLPKILVTWSRTVRDAEGKVVREAQESVDKILAEFKDSSAFAAFIKAGRVEARDLDWFVETSALHDFYESFPEHLRRRVGYIQHQYGIGFRSQAVKDAERLVTKGLGAISPATSDTWLPEGAYSTTFSAVNLPPVLVEQLKLYNELTGMTFTAEDMEAANVKLPDLNGLISSELHKRLINAAVNGETETDGYRKDLATLKKIRDAQNVYGFREWASPMLGRVLEGSFSDIFNESQPTPEEPKRLALMPKTMDLLQLRKDYLTQTVNSLRNRALARELILSQDEDGMPLVLAIPSAKQDRLALIPKGILIEMGQRWAAATGQRFDPALDVRQQLVALESETLPSGEYIEIASPFPSIDRFRVRKGDAEAVVKHWIERPRKLMVHGVDALDLAMRVTQWSKLMGVAYSLFFAGSMAESGIAGSGIKINVLWGKDATLAGTKAYSGRGPVPALRKMRDLAVLEAAGDPDLADVMHLYSLAGIELGGETYLDAAGGPVDQTTENLSEAVTELWGESWGRRAKIGARWLVGRPLSERYFGKPGVRGGIFQASKIYLADQLAREEARRTGADWDLLTESSKLRILKSIAPFINAAYGADNWKKYLWATPRAVQVLNLLFFAPQWTWAAFNIAGGGLLTGGLLGNPMTETTRRLTARNAFVMGTLVLTAIPAMLQTAGYLLAKAAGGGDPDDRPLPEQNEIGRKSYIDVTPILRMAPWYEGAPTLKRRVYIRFGKQAYEVYQGWLVNAWATAMGKLSSPAKIVVEQITGKSPGSDWTLEFNGRGLAGWVSAIDRDGEKSFLKSRFGYAVQKFIPMSVMASVQNSDAGPLSLIAPLSHGKSQGAATADLVLILNTVAEDSTWKYARRTPGMVENLQGLGAEILDAAERNGYDTKKIVTTAKGVVLGTLYKQFTAAMDEQDQKLMDRIANRILRVGGTLRGLTASVKSRRAVAGREATPEEIEAMDKAMGQD